MKPDRHPGRSWLVEYGPDTEREHRQFVTEDGALAWIDEQSPTAPALYYWGTPKATGRAEWLQVEIELP